MKKTITPFDKGHLALTLGFTTILVLLVLLTTNAVNRVDELNQQLQRVVKDYNKKASLIQIMRQSARERIFIMHHMLLEEDPFELDELALEVDEHGAQFASARQLLLSLQLNIHERRLLDIQTAYARQVLPIQRGAVAKILSGEREQAHQQLIKQVLPLQHKMLAALSHLESMQAKAIEQTVKDAEEQRLDTQQDFFIMGGAALLTGIPIFLLTLLLTKRLSHQAHHDPLTGISNRRGFELNLKQLLQQPSGHEESYLCLMDLDNFKPVNDTCGHAVGDTLLQDMVHKMSKNIRRQDLLARMGGDEFALLLKGCPLEQTFRITKSIQQSINARPYRCNGQEFPLGISIGVVEINDDTTSDSELIAQADAACYSAKHSGRDRIHIIRDGEAVELTEASLT